jgi:hypothetical protein
LTDSHLTLNGGMSELKDRKPLDEKVRDWLESQGYRLEYEAHRAFLDAGLSAAMGRYIDSRDGKPREIDVSVDQVANNNGLHVFCECKYSKAKPWLVMQSGAAPSQSLDWMRTPRFPSAIHAQAIYQSPSMLPTCWHFSEATVPGHTLIQGLKTDNQDVAYDALKKIANAAWDYVETVGPYIENEGLETNIVVFPCLIVDGPLFAVQFDSEQGEFQIIEINIGRIAWSGCRGGTMVDVVNVDALKLYAQEVAKTFKALAPLLPKLRKPYEAPVSVIEF